jgi:hypothetical protein
MQRVLHEIQTAQLHMMKSTLFYLLFLAIFFYCVIESDSFPGDEHHADSFEDDSDTVQELHTKTEELRTKCVNQHNRDSCEEVAGGFAQELLGFINLALASSNDTFVSQVAPKLQKSWETVLNITEKISSVAEPGERLLDSKLRNLTSLCNQTLQSLTRRTADFHAAHTSILKAARRSYLPGTDHSLETCIRCNHAHGSRSLFQEL